MCAIIGYCSQQSPISPSNFELMRDTMQHRGPDDSGATYFLPEADNYAVALGHRRLSFFDLSENGQQPLANATQTLWITYNGEVYNYKAIRTRLESLGYTFRTQTDTEVILLGYEAWGAAVLEHLEGMFAFGIWNTETQTLFLARDRFGIKPLYYTFENNAFIFASELKAIVARPQGRLQLNLSAVADFLNYRYVPSPYTIWEAVYKLEPAQYLSFDFKTGAIHKTTYWQLTCGEELTGINSLITQTRETLAQSAAAHVQADVPIGAFLSGGYDSSSLCALLANAQYPLSTYSLGFDNWENSEHHIAKSTADYLGLSNTATIENGINLDVLSRLAWFYDEPLADISIVPTYILSRLARTQVKAVVSGEGADELFGGYWWQKRAAAGFPEDRPQPFLRWRQPLKSLKSYWSYFTEKPQPLIASLDKLTQEYAEAMAMGRFDKASLEELLHPRVYATVREDIDWFYRQHLGAAHTKEPLKAFQYADVKTFMAELVLTKVDRASMANSLEVRVPFLNHHLFERVFKLKTSTYYRATQAKWLLVESVKSLLPASLFQRQKQGFVGPDRHYQVLDLYKTILANSRLVELDIIQAPALQRLLDSPDEHWRLWKLAILELWCKEWLK